MNIGINPYLNGKQLCEPVCHSIFILSNKIGNIPHIIKLKIIIFTMLSFLKYFISLTVPNNSIADIIKNISFIPASSFSTTVAAFAAILYELIVCENAGKKENIDKNSDNNTAIISFPATLFLSSFLAYKNTANGRQDSMKNKII